MKPLKTLDGIPIRNWEKAGEDNSKENFSEVFDAHVGIFKLGHGDMFKNDVSSYQALLDEAAKEVIILIDEVREFVHKENHEPYFLVMLRYHRIYLEPVKTPVNSTEISND